MTTPTLAPSLALLWSLAGVAACGSSPAQLTDGGAALTAEAACTTVASARCARVDSCSASTAIVRRYGDAATCADREKQSCLNGLGAPGTAATPTSVAACAAALTAESCADFENGVLPSACVPPAGPRTLGARCATSAQCQSTYCAVHRGDSCGVCAAPQVAGAECSDVACSRGLTCVAATSLCQTPGAMSAACRRDSPCGFGLSCVGAITDGGIAGSCQTGGAQVGLTCDPRRQTAPECDRALGLYCEPTTGKCARTRDAADGESCGLATGGMEGQCKNGGLCVGTTARVAGHCVGAAAVGGACDLDVGPPCLTPYRCIVGDGGTRGACQLVSPATCG